MRYLLLLTAVLLVACRTDGAPPQANESADGPEVEAVNDSLHLSLRVPARVTTGGPIDLELRVANVSGRALDLYLTGREPTADVIVRDAAGSVVWRNLQGAVPAILLLKPLPPGDSLVLHERWDARAAAAGEYTIEARLLTDADPLVFPQQRITITR